MKKKKTVYLKLAYGNKILHFFSFNYVRQLNEHFVLLGCFNGLIKVSVIKTSFKLIEKKNEQCILRLL